MTQISIYELSTRPLEKVLPQLLEKALSAGKRCVVRTSSEEYLEMLNTLLWSFSTRTFLPHGSAKDGFAEHQPIWLTTYEERPNRAEILILIEGASATDFKDFERCLDVYNRNTENAFILAKQRIECYANAGCQQTYWQQLESGGWKENPRLFEQ